MKKKMIIFGLTLIMVIGTVGMAFAAGPGGRWLNADKDWVPPLTKLNLTDEQYSKLREICTDFFNKTQELRTGLSEKVYELKMLYLQKDPDEAAIEAKKKEIADLREELLKLRQDKIDKTNEVLTKDQLAELGAMRGQGFGGRGHRGGFGGFRGAVTE